MNMVSAAPSDQHHQYEDQEKRQRRTNASTEQITGACPSHCNQFGIPFIPTLLLQPVCF